LFLNLTAVSESNKKSGKLVWSGKKYEKHGLAFFNLFGKGDAAYYFLHSCSCL